MSDAMTDVWGGSRLTRRRSQRRAPAVVGGAALVGLLLVACSGDPFYADNSGLDWIEHPQGCMRETEDRPVERAINHTDPELCGREVTKRSKNHVRIPPPVREDTN